MKAVCWFGKRDIRVEQVDDPKILNPRDAIVRVTSTAICGSDLHLYDGYVPGMRRGDILGRFAVHRRSHQVIEDPGPVHDRGLFRVGQRDLDDLDPEKRGIGILIGSGLAAPTQLSRRANARRTRHVNVDVRRILWIH